MIDEGRVPSPKPIIHVKINDSIIHSEGRWDEYPQHKEVFNNGFMAERQMERELKNPKLKKAWANLKKAREEILTHGNEFNLKLKSL